MDDNKKKSLMSKIMTAMILIVFASLTIVMLVIVARMRMMRSELIDYNKRLGDAAGEESSGSMEKEIANRLMELAGSKADIVDSNFGHFKSSVELLASDATYLYEHADDFGRIMPEEPKAENDGKLVVHMTHSEQTDMSDPAIIDEAGLLGNEINTLMSSHIGNVAMAKCYLATETGLMIEADRDSSDKIDEDGNVKFYEPQKRPWFVETKEANATHFTNITPEASGKRIGMMCGSPITKDGRFMGVACAGMYLDDVDAMVNSTNLGEGGIACIVNNNGQLLFTSDTTGTLTITKETADFDLRGSEDTEMAQLVTDALKGEEGYRIINFSDSKYYVAFSPMETVGWSFLILLPEERVMESTTKLLSRISDITGETGEATLQSFRFMIYNILGIGVIAILVAGFTAFYVSSYIVAPVKELTGKVSRLEGEDLDFEWDGKTNDEIQTLAESFGKMTIRMKEYIDEVTKVTAEKERIGAELNVATQIQADMLPRIFPPFPERSEFEIYATMDPAKEVGGDFYDFFLIDDSHLGLVMADVSGKGVPAALFMVIAKTLIKNRALLGGATPSTILEYANEQLCEGNEAELFVTVWLAIIDLSTGKGLAANAGHEHPVIKRADGKWELVTYRHSPAVATMPGIHFKEHEFELNPGDRLFVYTDGVPEATDSNDELYGTDRLLDVLNNKEAATTDELLRNVRADIEQFVQGAPQFDDITMLGLYWFGK